jgi:ribosomal protein S11
MFKLIFKLISLIVIVALVIIGLAVWKGGEPFRWFGKKAETAGKVIIEIGDRIDKIRQGSKEAGKKLKEIKKEIEEIKDRSSKANNGTIDKGQEP